MENQFPKNVRQIGNVSDTPRIYVEDYVDTFLNQLCDKADENPTGAFLIGHTVRQEEQDCIYISGAVQMEEIDTEGPDIAIGEETWKRAGEDCEKYFEGGKIIGWFISLPGHPLLLNGNLTKIHEQYFAHTGTVFIMKDAAEKDELYFAYKYKELMQMGGHYIYYEKNPSMQNYMVTRRKKIGVTPSEVVEDKAAKNFRSIVKERFEVQEQRHTSRVMYAASVFLVLVVLIIGVTTMNNYDKMKSVQSSLDYIKETVSPGKEGQTVETSAQPKSGTEDSEPQEDQGEGDTDDGGSVGGQTDGQASGQDASTQGKTDTNSGGDTAASTMKEMSEDIYIVEKGDTLARISKKVYGDTSHVDAICKMNGLSDGNLIFIGQKLLLP